MLPAALFYAIFYHLRILPNESYIQHIPFILLPSLRFSSRKPGANALEMRLPMYEVRFSMYDLGELPREARDCGEADAMAES